MSERDTCPECDVEIAPWTTRTFKLHDGNGHYYLAKGCANCDLIGMRLFPSNGAKLKREVRELAEIDPNPPADIPDDCPRYPVEA